MVAQAQEGDKGEREPQQFRDAAARCEHPYYYENGTSTIVLPILNVLRCMCFEDMSEVRTFSLGGINMSSAITLNDGSKMPLPHVCADITIGPPSLFPSVEAALKRLECLDVWLK